MDASSVSVKELYIYPLKSARGIKLDQSPIFRHGMLHDRMLVLVKKQNDKYIPANKNIKNYEIICQMEGNVVTVSLPENEKKFNIDLTSVYNGEFSKSIDPSKVIQVKLWGLTGDVAKIENDDLNQALSAYLGESVSVTLPVGKRYVIDGPHKNKYEESSVKEDDHIYFADLAPIMLASKQSLEHLNKILEEKGEPAVQMECFRPNIVLDAPGKEPFWENAISTFQIGDVRLKRFIGCTRCKMTTYDFSIKDYRKSQEPLVTLTDISFDDYLEGIVFGQYCTVEIDQGKESSLVKVGDMAIIS